MPEAPSSADQVAVRPRASDLGLSDMTLPEMRELAARIPFERAFAVTSRIAARIWQIPEDGRAQLEVARELFGDVPIVDAYERFLRRYEKAIIFSEQQLFVAQRLLVDNAQDVHLDAELSVDQVTDIAALLVHGHDIADAQHMHLEQTNVPSQLDMIAFLIQTGAYSQRNALFNSFSRSYTLFVEYARRVQDERLPLDEWAREDGFGLSIEEQLSIGFALGSSTQVFDDDPSKHSVLREGPFLTDTTLADREEDARNLMSADRQWYADAFAADEDAQSVRNVAWETTPFLQKPFLRLREGHLLLVSPRSIASWIGDGFYYRLLACAQKRRTRKNDLSYLFTSYYGNLVETYALDLMRSVYPEEEGGPRVFGDQPYGKGGGSRTPDIVIDCGRSIVAFEVRSGFLARRVRIAGEPRELVKDLDRLLFRKIGQLGNRVADLLAGTARVDEIDFANAEEIWPVVVTAQITLLEPLYDWVERERPEALKHPPVQSVVILDLENLELLAGLIQEGQELQEMLRERDKTNYRRLEFVRYALEELGADSRARAQVTEDAWARAGELMQRTFGFVPDEPIVERSNDA
jgi:hypothetical protein